MMPIPFPMLCRLELFQIWLNLPAASKMAEPHFKMLWSEQLLHHLVSDSEGRKTVVTTIAGKLEPATAEGEQPSPPPNSYAANADCRSLPVPSCHRIVASLWCSLSLVVAH